MKTHTVEPGTMAQAMSKAFTDPIDTNAVERGLNTKAYIAETQTTTYVGDVPTMLSNITSYLDRLAALAPRAEYFASNGFVTSLGYYVVNQILWEYRKANAVHNVGDDITDDGYDYPDARPISEVAPQAELPRFNAVPLLGAYKVALRQQRGTAFAADYPPTTPNEILGAMLTSEREKEKQAAYASMVNQEIDASPAHAAIRHAMAKRVEARPLITDRNKAEIAYVLDTIKTKAPELLTDDLWAQIPVWVQYKFIVNVFNQVTKAIAYEMSVNPTGSYTCTELMTLVNDMLLELDGVGRTAEVKLAFATGRLNERHVIERADPVMQPVITIQ